MKHSNIFEGQIDLLSLVQASIRTVNGQECIVIPGSFNPSIRIAASKNGIRKAYLNVAIAECPSNTFGNTHYVKAQVDKETRRELGLDNKDLGKYAPVIGNLKAAGKVLVERQHNATVEESFKNNTI